MKSSKLIKNDTLKRVTDIETSEGDVPLLEVYETTINGQKVLVKRYRYVPGSDPFEPTVKPSKGW